MRIFIDDSGDFGWVKPQISLHCAVTVCSSSLVELFRRQLNWKNQILGHHRQLEIKASSLTDEQLHSFVNVVIAPEKHLKLTVVGIDTSLVTKKAFERWRDTISQLCEGAAKWSANRGLPVAQRQYKEMSGWFWNRSAENLALMLSLSEILRESLQNTIIHFHEDEFESEFGDLEIVIDRSFIRRPEHEVFWREFLRTYFQNSSRRTPLGVPRAWKESNHIFERTYCGDEGQINLSPLYREHTYFGDSRSSEGLQIADICANICLRYHRRKKWFGAYKDLRKFIVGPDGHPMTALVPEEEPSLSADGATRTQQEVVEHARALRPRLRKN